MRSEIAYVFMNGEIAQRVPKPSPRGMTCEDASWATDEVVGSRKETGSKGALGLSSGRHVCWQCGSVCDHRRDCTQRRGVKVNQITGSA
jgi:hypothetical protein